MHYYFRLGRREKGGKQNEQILRQIKGRESRIHCCICLSFHYTIIYTQTMGKTGLLIC